MPWDEGAFRVRVLARANQLGMGERDMMRKAGVSEDTFNKQPGAQGRTYNLVEAIANAVGWTVSEALGETNLSLDRLTLAVETALRAIPSDRQELLPEAIVSAYDVLTDRAHRKLPIDDSAISTIEAMLRARHRAR